MKTRIYTQSKYDNLDLRRRTLKFLHDNQDNYQDFPICKKPLIDQEDTETLSYFRDLQHKLQIYGTILSYGGFATGIFGYWTFKMKLRNCFIIGISSMLSSLTFPVYHYVKLNQFLDYASNKYESRGLYDDELWDYNKKRFGSKTLQSQ